MCVTRVLVWRRVQFKADSKIPNAGTFKITHEDHTLGNLVYMQLLKDPRVLYAGYRAPHPLENFIEVKVQTAEGATPQQALMSAMDVILKDLVAIESSFNTAVRHK